MGRPRGSAAVSEPIRDEHDCWCRAHPHPSLRADTEPGPCDCHMVEITALRAQLETKAAEASDDGCPRCDGGDPHRMRWGKYGEFVSHAPDAHTPGMGCRLEGYYRTKALAAEIDRLSALLAAEERDRDEWRSRDAHELKHLDDQAEIARLAIERDRRGGGVS